MANILLKIEYIGKNYAGFQRQNSQTTIQGTLEKALEETFLKKVDVVAAGRTDAGVHSYGQVVNFFVDTTIDIGNLPKVINFHLPDDISVVDAKIVDENFSARFDAKSKIYKYYIYNSRYRSAIYGEFSHQVPKELDIEKMKEASEYLIGTHDFTSFMGKNAVVKDAIRTIYSIEFEKNGNLIEIEFWGKSFLKNMIRIIVGTLVDIGSGRRPVEFMKEALDEKRRGAAGYKAPAKGLFLMEVRY